MDGAPVVLDRVPETLLWTLYHRAVEARRPDAVLHDPLAVELVERIDFPFVERFGAGEEFSQWQALRARCFDGAVRRFLAVSPEGTVVALGEGLETQAWRVGNGRAEWVTVDLPEVVALRDRLLPRDPRRRTIGASVLDERWLQEVGDPSAVLFTAQGLLMYLPGGEVHRLLSRMAARFVGASLVFDAVPAWLVRRSRAHPLRTSSGYEPPAWSWGLDSAEERRLRTIPGVAALRPLRLPRGRGAVHGLLLPLASRAPVLRRALLSVWSMRFS
ncbi:MAG TPA: class I SAM-dependent methyltransferase [Gaiellaceae bacterium]|nr:class I SAM-dependent methyltransferase [Gaiellaceae bacterium]